MDTGRTLTGAWIETGQLPDYPARERVAPSRVRGLKLEKMTTKLDDQIVAPSRVRGLKHDGGSEYHH